MSRIGISIAIFAILVVSPAGAQPAAPTSSHGASTGVANAVHPTTKTGDLGQATPMAQAATLFQIYSPQELAKGVYIGSDYCLACHKGKATYKGTGHSHFLRRPLPEWSLVPGKGVLADYDNNGVDDFIQGLDFNQISSIFDKYKPNAPVLSMENGTYYIRVGQLKCPVIFMQAVERYVVKIPVSDTATGLTQSNYFAPLAYTPGRGYSANSPQNWYDDNNNPRWAPGVTTAQLTAHTGNYSRTCVGCHATGIRSIGESPTGEFVFKGYVATLFAPNDPNVFDYDGDGNMDLMNIGCESCHGPGSAHVLGGGDPSKIINPEKVDAQLANDICGRCHVEPKSVPNGTFSWPFNDQTMTDWYPGIGQPLADFMEDDSPLWPDGKHAKVTRPYRDFYKSPKPTFAFHMVRCYECHDPHERVQDAQIVASIDDGGVTIPTEVDNDTLCLACHATHGPFADITPEMVADFEANRVEIGTVVSAHTHHPFAPDRILGLSRCVTCHMPAIAGHGTLSLPSHTFEPISPVKTLIYQAEGGMPNACAQSCHAYKVNIFGLGLDPNTNNSVWNEPFDRSLATELEKWYGPEGLWWKTDAEGLPTAEE